MCQPSSDGLAANDSPAPARQSVTRRACGDRVIEEWLEAGGRVDGVWLASAPRPPSETKNVCVASSLCEHPMAEPWSRSPCKFVGWDAVWVEMSSSPCRGPGQ